MRSEKEQVFSLAYLNAQQNNPMPNIEYKILLPIARPSGQRNRSQGFLLFFDSLRAQKFEHMMPILDTNMMMPIEQGQVFH